MRKTGIIILFLFLFFPALILARLGVGVAAGKIEVKEKLKPGVIYNLPPFSVINTGDEPSDYTVDIQYHEKQTRLRPPQSWFIFSPQTFRLNPGKVQVVDVKLNLPLATKPGNYFAYLEGMPIQKAKAGVTTIGIAAASKLYFTIVPANIFQAFYYKLISFWEVYAPWPQWILGIIIVIVLATLIRKYFNIQINLKKPE